MYVKSELVLLEGQEFTGKWYKGTLWRDKKYSDVEEKCPDYFKMLAYESRTRLWFEFGDGPLVTILDHSLTIWMNSVPFGKAHCPFSSPDLTTSASSSSFFVSPPPPAPTTKFQLSNCALPHTEFENALPHPGDQLMKWRLDYHCLLLREKNISTC